MKETMIRRIEIESGRFISSVNNARRWNPDFSRLFRPVIEFSHTDIDRERDIRQCTRYYITLDTMYRFGTRKERERERRRIGSKSSESANQ